MKNFSLKLPLSIKLILIGLIPLTFLAYQSAQLFHEKKQRLKLLDSYRERIHQSLKITTLIDDLQLERKFSFNFTLQGLSNPEMLASRLSTDSTIVQIDAQHDFSLKDYKIYTFLDTLTSIRALIDSKRFGSGQVMHYYSTMIFRLNTLNSIPTDETYLESVVRDFAAQKLLSEMVTYLGIITANVYNVLYTKQYMVETLIGTVGTKQVYDTYLVEFSQKASDSRLKDFRAMQNTPELKAVSTYLDTLFKAFKFDSSYNYVEWGQVSTTAINRLRQFQKSILNEVESKLDGFYQSELSEVNRSLISISLILLLVIAVIVYTMITIIESMKQLKNAAIRISRGETNVTLKGLSDDVIGSLANSISEIDRSNKNLAEAAVAIGKGNFDTHVHLRSQNDLLGNAILQMKENLKKSTEETEKTKEEFRELADFTPQIVWTSTPEGKPDYFNRQWYEFTGFTKGNDFEKTFSIVHPEDQQVTSTAWKTSLRVGMPYKIETRLFDKNSGDYRWFLVRSIPIKDAMGNIIKWFGTFTDIHETKTLSEKLELLVEQRTEQLNKANQEINRANTNLERSNSDLQQFAHVTSHDLKEPLRKISIFSDQLKRKARAQLTEEGAIYLDKIGNSAARMSSMVEGILKYSMADSIQERFERVVIAPIIGQIQDDLELLLKEKKGAIIYPNLNEFFGVPILIHQLFYNLINNSLKFSADTRAPIVTISSDIQEGLNYIKIKDNGIGFEQEYANTIFNSFTRLHSQGKYEGTGLGLSLCKKIVLRHNGFIRAHGEVDKGAEFTIAIPVSRN